MAIQKSEGESAVKDIIFLDVQFKKVSFWFCGEICSLKVPL